MRHMDTQSATADERIAQFAARQHGVVSSIQLSELGVSRTEVRRRVEAGRLRRLHRGVYAVGHTAPSCRREWMAAILACRRRPRVERAADGSQRVLDHWGAALSHLSAASLWRLRPDRGGRSVPDGLVDVSVPGRGGKASRSGLRVHRCPTLDPRQVTLREGIPVTTPARTIADLKRSVTGETPLLSSRELRRAIRQAEVLGLPIGPDDSGDRSRSDLEGDFLALCRRYGIPAPEINVRIGRYLVDFLWRERRLVVETDSYLYHRGRIAFQDDRSRDLDLRAWGIDVLRVSEKQLEEEPGRVAAIVHHALRVGADAAGST